jgi:hypothetical protein
MTLRQNRTTREYSKQKRLIEQEKSRPGKGGRNMASITVNDA